MVKQRTCRYGQCRQLLETHYETPLRPAVGKRNEARPPWANVLLDDFSRRHRKSEVGPSYPNRCVKRTNDDTIINLPPRRRSFTIDSSLERTRWRHPDVLIRARLFKSDLRPTGKRMILSHSDAELISCIKPGLQPREIDHVPANTDCGSTATYFSDDLVAHPLLNFNTNGTMKRIAQKTGNGIWQRFRNRRRGCNKLNVSFNRLRMGCHIALDFRGGGEHCFRMFKQDLSGRRWRDSAPFPDKQRRSDYFFQLGETFADG